MAGSQCGWAAVGEAVAQSSTSRMLSADHSQRQKTESGAQAPCRLHVQTKASLLLSFHAFTNVRSH